MNKETRAALLASIQHWRENAKAETVHGYTIGSGNCALCKLFIPSCIGCPVSRKTGRSSCSGTPYDIAWSAKREWRYATPVEIDSARADAHAAATAFADWLEALLPEDGK